MVKYCKKCGNLFDNLSKLNNTCNPCKKEQRIQASINNLGKHQHRDFERIEGLLAD